MKSNEKEIDEISNLTCDRCDGCGEDYKNPLYEGAYFKPCPKCNGEGNVDWIENIFGKKPIIDIEEMKRYVTNKVLHSMKTGKPIITVSQQNG